MANGAGQLVNEVSATIVVQFNTPQESKTSPAVIAAAIIIVIVVILVIGIVAFFVIRRRRNKSVDTDLKLKTARNTQQNAHMTSPSPLLFPSPHSTSSPHSSTQSQSPQMYPTESPHMYPLSQIPPNSQPSSPNMTPNGSSQPLPYSNSAPPVMMNNYQYDKKVVDSANSHLRMYPKGTLAPLDQKYSNSR
eukprot:TRINITY_DN2314_c0_g2_i2.p1 TRINITY_DN2314_c0_g2~~TRINITY_DN2314_c0_g2_i2.p1  ORF type:complete len:191 (-),score=28.19 TRINITY_DN2314_c0_g2_i2:11-583(-)